MSEYWKSTPKYWCKYCKTFVRDTKLEKTNHEATPKHQGNLRRSLRDLHKGHEREERDKQRAKDEIDRLNGVVSGNRSMDGGNTWERKSAIPQPSPSAQATPADRKKQLQQLAEMGVAVPDEFRKEMAMAGDWQVTSQRVIYDAPKKEDGDVKPDRLAIGVRKRKFEGQEEEEEAGEAVVRRGWGSTTRTYPGANDEGDDLDALLNGTKALKRNGQALIDTRSSSAGFQPAQADNPFKEEDADNGTPNVPSIKKETTLETFATLGAVPAQDDATSAPTKTEQDTEQPGVFFKKRKARPMRQKD
ncbi:hypothetical protein P7C71_g2355, partial [Lecanoromycetidae sp. Uapishka_2]